MFCPRIKDECRPDCVKWNPLLGKCSEEIIAEAYIKAGQLTEAYEYLMQISRISWRLEMKRLLNDPMIPIEVKEAIQEAKDATTLEKLLGDVGLLG